MNRLRQSKNSSTKIDYLKNCFGDNVTTPKKIANFMNYKFSILGNYVGPKIPFKSLQYKTNKTFSFRYITEKECFQQLKQLNANKPLGPSSIPAWALQDGATAINSHLTFIIRFHS